LAYGGSEDKHVPVVDIVDWKNCTTYEKFDFEIFEGKSHLFIDEVDCMLKVVAKINELKKIL